MLEVNDQATMINKQHVAVNEKMVWYAGVTSVHESLAMRCVNTALPWQSLDP